MRRANLRPTLASSFSRWFRGRPTVEKAEPTDPLESNDVDAPEATLTFGRRRVFVGSSTEGRPIAEKVLGRLSSNGLSTLPWFDFFHSERPPLQELEHLTLQVDGAVLVATPDDQVIIRERRWHQARDNVLFEYGLFAGAIGRRKCALLVPDVETFRIPSDFLGVACCERFQVDAPDSAIELSAASLAAALARPPRAEDTQARGRRLLRLLGWVRDEAFRLVQEWETDHGRTVIADRVIAVSAFIQEDIDSLNLRAEYEEIERLLLAAIDSFPQQSAGFDRSALEDHFHTWLPGRVPPNRMVVERLLYNMDRAGILQRYFTDCPGCARQWQERPYGRQWAHDDYSRYWEDYWYHSRHAPSYLCGPFGYAAGVAEAVHTFERHLSQVDPFVEIRDWSQRRLPRFNDALLAFERRLHEAIFGPL
jgi:predicted nucleotide-binding protein